jgi:hypothetical protein
VDESDSAVQRLLLLEPGIHHHHLVAAIPKRAHITYVVSLRPVHQTNGPRARSKYEPITKDGKGDAEGQVVDAEGDWLSVRNGMLRAPRAEDE